jgi:hypothetical protein
MYCLSSLCSVLSTSTRVVVEEWLILYLNVVLVLDKPFGWMLAIHQDILLTVLAKPKPLLINMNSVHLVPKDWILASKYSSTGVRTTVVHFQLQVGDRPTSRVLCCSLS